MSKLKIILSHIILFIAIILCISTSSYAQSGYTQVTATIHDSNGVLYANAPYRVSFFDPGTSGQLPTLSNRSPFQQSFSGYATDGFGHLSISVADNSFIASASGATGTQWTFNICAQAGLPCFNVTTAVSGNTDDISAILNAAAPPLPPTGTAIALQVNSVPNVVQTKLNLIAGTNVSLSDNGSGGVSITASPGTAGPGGGPTQIQWNSGVLSGATGITTPDNGSSLVVKGPIPSANLAAFTRPTNFNGCSTLATINIGTPTTANLTSGACFQTNNGLFNDGITIYNAGPAVTISSPSAPTVTPNTISSGGVNLGGGNYTPNTVVNGATGSSTYSYILVAFDQFGGFAAPSTATTIANGPASLGAFSCAISTETRSVRNVTKNYSSSCAGAVAGAMSLDTGTPPNPAGTFGGFFNTQTVNSSTQVVYAGPYDSSAFGWNSTDNGNSGTNSSTGGTSYFFNSNHLLWTYGTGVWRYGICAERPGDASYHRIGMTRPSTSQSKDIQFDDYGATMMAGQVYPPYFTDAVCNGVAGQNDPLTTTITAGAGTTTITLANAASNGVTSATALFDNGPGLLAAVNSVSTGGHFGEVYVPPVTNASNNFFVINSYTTLPANVKIRQAGAININEPINLTNNDLWSGDASAQCGAPGLGYYGQPTACIYMNNAFPGIYISGSNVTMQNLSLLTSGSANRGTMIVDDGNIGKFSYVGFAPDGATDTDFLTEPLVLRGGNGSNVCQYELDHINFNIATFSTTPGSWNPAIFRPYAQASNGTLAQGGCTINMSKMSVSGHGIVQEGGGVNWNFDNIYRQGGIMPFLWDLNGSAASPEIISFNTAQLDTDGSSILSIGNNTGTPVTDIVKGYLVNANGGTSFGGFGPSAYDISYSGITTAPNANGGSYRGCAGANTTTVLNCNFDLNAYIGNNAKAFFPLAPVAAAPTVTTVSGGSYGASVGAEFAIAAVGPDGGETFITPLSSAATTDASCPGSGKCSFQITWTGVTGASTFNLYGCGVVGISGVTCPAVNQAATGITSPYTFTNGGTIGGGHNPNAFTQTGVSGITKNMVWALQFPTAESTAPTCLPNYDQIFGIASGHRLSFCDNAGSVDQVVGANTTDTLANKTVSAGVYTGSGTGSGSLTLTGVIDAPTNVTVTTGATFSLADGFSSTIANNQEATAAAAVTYTLPIAAKGLKKCVINSNNGTNPDTGVLTVATSAAGQFIIHFDGTVTASGGNETSGGAAGDSACFLGISSTQWQILVQQGTWTKH